MYRLSDLVAEIATERKGTAFHVRRLLKAVYKIALINEWCSKDRTLTIEPVAIQPKRLLVSNEGIARVLEVARQHSDKHKVCALLLCAATGQRGSEIMKLHWENIREDSILFPAEIRKQRVEHTVWLNHLAREALSYLKKGTGPIFPMAHHNWLSDFGKVQGRKAKVKGFGVHQLRKAVISNLLSQGVVNQFCSATRPTRILNQRMAVSPAYRSNRLCFQPITSQIAPIANGQSPIRCDENQHPQRAAKRSLINNGPMAAKSAQPTLPPIDVVKSPH
ncbi:tyrosine-type recombinase/integrase [Ruegeria sp. HKCCD7255]|uniref:tyrosine-type recombinase/integrase n=1 Tax=Ruegeria sp. HKCCD7255 TaxID=2683004 RepID=UPI001487D7D7|nr:tyrosine-type recombinase/integrase [Ruegeria sp. HKCCD7255]